MSHPFRAIADGLSIAGTHWQILLGTLLVAAVSQIILWAALRWIFGDRLSDGDYYSLGLAGWLLPASLISLLWYGLAQVSSPLAGGVLTGIVLVPAGLTGLAYLARSRAGASTTTVVLLVSLAILFLLLRLAFVSRAVLPLYFDSAQHYHHIAEILSSLRQPGSGTWSPANYYHLGFHFLAAYLTFIAGAEVAETMLVLGQVILALLPFSVFFPVRYTTRSNAAGLFAVVLAAFGWYMPAHAVDWGKYPALAGLALLPFVLSLAYLSIRRQPVLSGHASRVLNTLAGAGALVAVFLHSRSLVVFAIAALAWGVTSIGKKLGKRAQHLLIGLLLAALVAEVLWIRTEGILGPLLDAYGRQAVLTAIAVLFLSILAYLAYPGLVLFCLLAISLLLASLFIPLDDLIPGYPATTLLDRPFVQMILYLPLSLLAAFGLAGLEQRLQGKAVDIGRLRIRSGFLAGIGFILLAAVHGLFKYDLYPSDCCAIASQDDLAAIRWLDENLPGQALILTSSTDLKVLPTDEYQGSAGGDAGAWITPLTGRSAVTLPFNTDFSQPETLETLCRLQVEYVYVGRTGYYFDDSGMAVQPGGYRGVFELPKARVYEVIGCE